MLVVGICLCLSAINVFIFGDAHKLLCINDYIVTLRGSLEGRIPQVPPLFWKLDHDGEYWTGIAVGFREGVRFSGDE